MARSQALTFALVFLTLAIGLVSALRSDEVLKVFMVEKCTFRAVRVEGRRRMHGMEWFFLRVQPNAEGVRKRRRRGRWAVIQVNDR